MKSTPNLPYVIKTNMYNDLTPEEQADLFAEIIAPEILREIGEKLEQEKDKEDSEGEPA
ncbi:MAG: hypothetical protein ISR95_00175 [Candidatus Marinimicrobia bacterium]|nr:hypothetical protein [Candidatus Neomarinimicrobiota bacterium]MBL7046046.1 hypothetical protein [Candidatus Neomarinimicrobiota bacterium]